MKKLLFIVITGFLVLGCSAKNISERGEYITKERIEVGTPRNICLQRFGDPLDTRFEDKKRIDSYRIVQGETLMGKIGKSTMTIALGFFSWGLSELIAHPVTKKGSYVNFEIFYDNHDRVKTVRFYEKR